MNAAAIPDAVSDDSEGYGTWDPTGRPGAIDISITPNRLLQSTLAAQVGLIGIKWWAGFGLQVEAGLMRPLAVPL